MTPTPKSDEQRRREHEAEHAKFYLHSDDNYYWTPEAWREFQSLRAQLASRDERIERLRVLVTECLQAMTRVTRIVQTHFDGEQVREQYLATPETEHVIRVIQRVSMDLAEDDRLRGQG